MLIIILLDKSHCVVFARLMMSTPHACRLFGIAPLAGNEFFKVLQTEAFVNANELQSDIVSAAQRLWTSAQIMS
jgi:hypothetical protein